jgi:3-deoxy-D-manno-octulosonic-acid transferase
VKSHVFKLKGKLSILQLNVRWFLTLKVVYAPGEIVIHGSVFLEQPLQTSLIYREMSQFPLVILIISSTTATSTCVKMVLCFVVKKIEEDKRFQ